MYVSRKRERGREERKAERNRVRLEFTFFNKSHPINKQLQSYYSDFFSFSEPWSIYSGVYSFASHFSLCFSDWWIKTDILSYKISANSISEILIYSLNNNIIFKQNIWLIMLEMCRIGLFGSWIPLYNHINCIKKYKVDIHHNKNILIITVSKDLYAMETWKGEKILQSMN